MWAARVIFLSDRQAAATPRCCIFHQWSAVNWHVKHEFWSSSAPFEPSARSPWVKWCLRVRLVKPLANLGTGLTSPESSFSQRMHCQSVLINHAGFFRHETFCHFFCSPRRHNILPSKKYVRFASDGQHFMQMNSESRAVSLLSREAIIINFMINCASTQLLKSCSAFCCVRERTMALHGFLWKFSSGNDAAAERYFLFFHSHS